MRRALVTVGSYALATAVGVVGALVVFTYYIITAGGDR
jgi:hypothetical protein